LLQALLLAASHYQVHLRVVN